MLIDLLEPQRVVCIEGGAAENAHHEASASSEQEMAARAPRRGRTKNARNNILTADQEREQALKWRASQDTRALDALVKSHLGLVVHIAMEFRRSTTEMRDLVQEGNRGLVIAAQRFDPNRAARLATYASYWIRACMIDYVIRSSGPVRIGGTAAQRKIFFGLGRARRKLEHEGGDVNCEALAAELRVAQEDVESMVTRLAGSDVSLDAPRGDRGQHSAHDSLADNAATPEDTIAQQEENNLRREQLLQGLRSLNKREQMIIRARHMNEQPATLEALGRVLGITRERVRQIEARAMKKLRTACNK